MICVGLTISSFGAPWQLYVGHGLFIGFLGNGGLNAPLYVYVSRWFDRRRGSALAFKNERLAIRLRNFSIDAAGGACELPRQRHRRGHGIWRFCDSCPHILKDVDTVLEPGTTLTSVPTPATRRSTVWCWATLSVTETGVEVLCGAGLKVPNAEIIQEFRASRKKLGWQR
jgi:hypothetical protein